MGKPCPVSEKRNQLPLPVVGDFDLKLPSCSRFTEKLQGEKLVASHVASANPRSPLQTSRVAATSGKTAETSLKPDALKRLHMLDETSAFKENSSRRTLTLESQTMLTANGMQRRDVLGEQEEVSPVRKQPCPPSTSRDKGHHTVLAFRRRKFRGEWHGSTSSERTNAGKSEGCTENRSKPITITIDNFTVDFPGTKLKWPTDREGECSDDTLKTQLTKEYYEEDNNGNQERSNEKFSDCMLEVSKGATFARTERLTDRKQVKPFADLDSKMPRHVCKVINYCKLNNEKQELSPSPLDTFARRQLGCNVEFCRENLELNESFASKMCKDFDTAKEVMINNWLIDVSKVR